MLSFFQSGAQRLLPFRKRFVIAAIVGFVLLTSDVLLGGPLPTLLTFGLMLVTWWCWLTVMLIGLFCPTTRDGLDKSSVQAIFPFFRYCFLVILLTMAVTPVIWFVVKYT